jgi:hypothetical protein
VVGQAILPAAAFLGGWTRRKVDPISRLMEDADIPILRQARGEFHK